MSIEKRDTEHLCTYILCKRAYISAGTTTAPLQARDFDPTGWELALVNTPGTDISSVQDMQLAGELDSLTLNNLYDVEHDAALMPGHKKP
ncbi:hypothetical protein AgCh_000006 [Apium graveolens]